jgi:hypothetical protein
MFYPPELLSWVESVSTHLPHLSRSEAQVLAWYSFAAGLVQGCGLSQVVYFLARLLGQEENNLRQRLRESLYDADDKRGTGRHELAVCQCFAPLLGWIMQHWDSEDNTLVLALDATTLRQTFTVLSISVILGRCAIPVAWVVLPATQPGAWKPHWLALLQQLEIPLPGWQVLVLADRGLYAKWLFNAIRAAGWHPLLRINAVGSCCLHATGQRLPLATLVALCRQHWWRGRVTCFLDERQLACSLLILWEQGQKDAWLLLTDLPPEQVSPTWYALRMGIEAGFKALKSAGLHWERTRMTAPARATRLWLVLALTCLRTALLAPPADLRPVTTAPYPRLSLFAQGRLRQLAAFIRAQPLPLSPLRMSALPPPPQLDFLDFLTAALKTYP